MLDTSPQKILVVEDDQAIRGLYSVKLAREGFHVQSSDNGKDGLKQAQKFKPHLILLDLRMPIMSGDEMLQRLRETDWGSDMRVIILTNISKSEAPHALRFLHVDRYVVKVHHTPSQVVDMVKEVLK